MRVLLLGFLLIGLPLSPSWSQDTITIAALGDSLFAGYGIAPGDAFPAQLERRLKLDGYDAHVINDGISGATATGGAARVNEVLAQKPDMVIIELGANDMLRGFPPQEVRANLEMILSRLKQAGVKLMVVGQKAPASYGHAYGKAFDTMFCDMARNYDAACYPSYLEGAYGHPDLMQPDGIHPNVQGVRVILDKMYPTVVAWMKKPVNR